MARLKGIKSSLAVGWQGRMSNGHQSRHAEDCIVIGKTILTKDQTAQALGNYTRSGVILTEAIARSKFKDAKDARDLARRMTVEDLYQIAGVGESTILAWGLLLIHCGIDPVAWMDRSSTTGRAVKVATLIARKKKRRKDRS